MDTKRIVAAKAIEYVKDGMVVGLGTGSTSTWAIKLLGEKMKEGLTITSVASSLASENLARELNIPIIPFSEVDTIDLYIDGADEVDKNFYLIKGGGGALLREKILAYNSKAFVVIVDETKMVETLGRFPLPVEIIPFASDLTIKNIQQLGCKTKIRQQAGKTFISDNSNLIIDCNFLQIPHPAQLNEQLKSIPGVVETGIFLHFIVSKLIVG